MSDNAKFVWESELGNNNYKNLPLNSMTKWILWLHLPQDLQIIKQ